MQYRHVLFDSGIDLLATHDDVTLELTLAILGHFNTDAADALERVVSFFVAIPLVARLF